MSSGDDKPTIARRRHDSEATREALLRAAREVFDECGYERATTRSIGERAGVDPALIARYFDGKEGLFLAAISAMSADEDKETTPRELVELLLERWETKGHSPISRALASPSLKPEVRDQVRELVGERVLRKQAEMLAERGASQPQLRSELLVALAVGIATTRANGTLGELAEAPIEEILEVLAPALDLFGSAAGGSG